MGTLIKYTLLFGLLVGTAFAAVTLEIQGATAYEHILRLAATEPSAPPSATSKPRPVQKPAVSVQEDAKARTRVAILKKAAPSSTPKAKKRTQVDPHISKAHKKALDDLVSSRVRQP